MMTLTTGSSVAGIITASATMFIAIAGVVSALTLFIPILRKVKATHEIVNGDRARMMRYQRLLIRALINADVPVPPDPQILEDARNDENRTNHGLLPGKSTSQEWAMPEMPGQCK